MSKQDLIPFLFYKPKTGVWVARSVWIVKVASWDYKEYDASWMDDKALGNNCLVPDVDQTSEEHTFNSEEEALEWIKNWWKAQ